MPVLGLGTWQNDDPEQCAESVRTALQAGYRHVDTAQGYNNEAAVGDGIAAADVPREEIFLATKVRASNLSYADVIETTERSLEDLGVDSLDLLYVHWPSRAYDPEETLPAFDELRDRELIEHVGVSNFTPEHVDRAREVLDAPIFANQVEMHPLLPQTELLAHAEETGYNLVAYSPLARGTILEDPTIRDIADKHDVSPAAVSLAWLREHDVAAIPKATSETHIRENLGSVRLNLSAEDIAAIDAIDRRDRRIDPDFAPDW
ncbi:aldo/keto reductase [Halorhabdus amylolytica]|uniref:aldo/keto reductase n=1 Tax=Halorhabdus amylolytica TaxID=2559573 RepID=UPI0010AA3BD8|nr:aldo/keto reductase [Halorhabdus amylolytica]